MSDEPTERDVEALAEAIRMRHWPATTAAMITRDVLASDWYAERIAEARREGAAEALEKAATEIDREAQQRQQPVPPPGLVGHRSPPRPRRRPPG